MPVYVIMHSLFVAMVVYMVYIRTLIPLKYLRDVYRAMEEIPYFWQMSLREFLE